MRKICFVSDECNGLSSAGGIGACVRGLSQWLAANGAQVDILITNLNQRASDISGIDARFVDNVVFLSETAQFEEDLHPPTDECARSYHVYQFLKDRDYDEVHFNDWRGSGFYTAMARRQGLFAATIVIIYIDREVSSVAKSKLRMHPDRSAKISSSVCWGRSRAIFTAASHAQRAADFLAGREAQS